MVGGAVSAFTGQVKTAVADFLPVPREGHAKISQPLDVFTAGARAELDDFLVT